MLYRAATVLPDENRERATTRLRGQLRVMADAAGATPDWSTLAVTGPTASTTQRGEAWFEWTGSVSVRGGLDLAAACDAAPHPATSSEATAPLPAAS